jgi:hypothetical protein
VAFCGALRHFKHGTAIRIQTETTPQYHRAAAHPIFQYTEQNANCNHKERLAVDPENLPKLTKFICLS